MTKPTTLSPFNGCCGKGAPGQDWCPYHSRKTIKSQRDRLAEAFIRGLEVGAETPSLAGDGDEMYQAFRDWMDKEEI